MLLLDRAAQVELPRRLLLLKRGYHELISVDLPILLSVYWASVREDEGNCVAVGVLKVHLRLELFEVCRQHLKLEELLRQLTVVVLGGKELRRYVVLLLVHMNLLTL